MAASGQLGIFTNGYWGHPAMKLSPEVNLLAFAHYVQALEYQRKSVQAVAILGAKSPHIQNLTVGGVSNAINLDSLATLNMDRLVMIKKLMDEVKPFVDQVYLPDVCAIAGMYADWFNYGAGVTNYLASPDLPLDSKNTKFDLPRRLHPGRQPLQRSPLRRIPRQGLHRSRHGRNQTRLVQGRDTASTVEGRDRSRIHRLECRRQVLLGQGSALPGPSDAGWTAGSDPGRLCLGRPAYPQAYRQGAGPRSRPLPARRIGVAQLQSTMGRHVARAIRASMLAELGEKHWQLLVDNIATGDVAIHNNPEFPAGEIEGVGVHEAPRGLLSHWTVDQGRQDRELSGGRALHLERLSA